MVQLSPRKYCVIGAILAAAVVISGCDKPQSRVSGAKSDTSASKTDPSVPLQEKAASGDVSAMLQLARMYDQGESVQKNQTKAFEWFLKGAQAGNVDAMIVVAQRLEKGEGVKRSYDESRTWWKRAAESGSPLGQYKHAQSFGWLPRSGVFIWGENLEQVRANARAWVQWLEQSARQHNLKAEHDLGMTYLLGAKYDGTEIIRVDFDKGLPLLLDAAQKGEWESQWALAVANQAGFGRVKKDPKESMKWWDQLAAQTDPEAMTGIGLRYEESNKKLYQSGRNKWRGRDLSFDETNRIAAEWLEKASSKGNSLASYYLANMYRSGRGVWRDDARATELLKTAASKGNSSAALDLGTAYYEGRGTAKDYALALEWLSKAANQSEEPYTAATAQNALGVFYELGLGVEKDLVVAYAWYNVAAAGNNEKAKTNRARVERTLSASELQEAQAISRDWQPEKGILRISVPNQAPVGTGGTRLLKQVASGSGFVISKNGNVLTNNHVVDGCKEVRVPAEGKTAKPIVADQANDLAVVKLDGDGWDSAVLSQWDDLRQGDDVVVFGYPLEGFLPSSGNITPGIVSALAGPGNNSSLIQITAPVQPGNSGGPVLNKKGAVVGMVVAKADAIKIARVTGDIPQNVNFAIAGPTIKSFLDGNQIDYGKQIGFLTLGKNTADLAREAKKYSLKLECWR